MNKLDKALSKIPRDYQQKILETLILIQEGSLEKLDIKKLKGNCNLYRVRIGIYRIQFKINNSDILILDISKRSDNTYK